jgi:hypothetical protein
MSATCFTISGTSVLPFTNNLGIASEGGSLAVLPAGEAFSFGASCILACNGAALKPPSHDGAPNFVCIGADF